MRCCGAWGCKKPPDAHRTATRRGGPITRCHLRVATRSQTGGAPGASRERHPDGGLVQFAEMLDTAKQIIVNFGLELPGAFALWWAGRR